MSTRRWQDIPVQWRDDRVICRMLDRVYMRISGRMGTRVDANVRVYERVKGALERVSHRVYICARDHTFRHVYERAQEMIDE